MTSSSDYYERKTAKHIDGTPIFENEEDAAGKEEVAAFVEKAWSCQFNSFGTLAPVDWWIGQYGRVIGYAEVKVRTHARDVPNAYKTVFLNLRKWLALMLAESGTGKPSCFIVKFTDGIFWIPLSDVDASQIRVGGCRRFVKSVNDREPVIEIPCDKLRSIENSPLWIPPA